ncbi:MAG: putative immunity protein [Patescibacteria group bacterium]
MLCYKLTDRDGYTQRGKTGETLWSEGFVLTLPETEKPQLCTACVIHAYPNLNLGLLLNPLHAAIKNPLIWEGECESCVSDWGKLGTFQLTILRQIPMPDWYVEADIRQRVMVRFAILSAEAVLSIFENRFPGDDRPRKAIEAAKEYLNQKGAAAARAAAAAADAAYAYAAYAYAAAADAAADVNFVELADHAVKMETERI